MHASWSGRRAASSGPPGGGDRDRRGADYRAVRLPDLRTGQRGGDPGAVCGGARAPPREPGRRPSRGPPAGGLAAGSRVVVVGGGSKRLEAAAEIAERRPDMHVTLLSVGPVMAQMRPEARRSISPSLRRLGIDSMEDATADRTTRAAVVRSDGRSVASTRGRAWRNGVAPRLLYGSCPSGPIRRGRQRRPLATVLWPGRRPRQARASAVQIDLPARVLNLRTDGP